MPSQRAGSAIGGAASGAAIGSAFVPGVGTGIGAGLGALFGLLAGGGSSDRPISPEAERLLQWELARQERANPLVESALRLAFARLPGAARTGLSVPTWSDVERQERWDPQSRESDEDFAQSPAMRALLRLQLLRMRMADPLLQAVQQLAAARMPGARAYQTSYGDQYQLPPNAPHVSNPRGRPPIGRAVPRRPLLPGA